jgi:catechol 2,3-dioxygenase-like lactoylglutathione lyase family enzyme
MPHLTHIALIVRDYDEALAFYVGTLGFTLVEDSYQPAQEALTRPAAGSVLAITP